MLLSPTGQETLEGTHRGDVVSRVQFGTPCLDEEFEGTLIFDFK